MKGVYRLNGMNIQTVATMIEMPWGSVYWLIEAQMERPILPQVFRRIGEPNWTVLEPSLDAACEKLQEYIAGDLMAAS